MAKSCYKNLMYVYNCNALTKKDTFLLKVTSLALYQIYYVHKTKR